MPMTNDAELVAHYLVLMVMLMLFINGGTCQDQRAYYSVPENLNMFCS